MRWHLERVPAEQRSPRFTGAWPWPGAGAPYDFRFFAEFSADTPFWCGLAVVPISSLQLTPHLSAELAEWCREYERETDTADFHWKSGEAAYAEYHERGRMLCARAQSELGADYLLTYEEWA